MKDQDQGRPLRRVVEYANGVLFATDGRPVRAVALVSAPPADGRPVFPISFSLTEGQPAEAVSF